MWRGSERVMRGLHGCYRPYMKEGRKSACDTRKGGRTGSTPRGRKKEAGQVFKVRSSPEEGRGVGGRVDRVPGHHIYRNGYSTLPT